MQRVVGEFSFLRVLLRAIHFIVEGKKRKAFVLTRLANRKFAELGATHTLFVGLFQDLSRAASSARGALNKTDDIEAIRNNLRQAVAAIEDARSSGMDIRRRDFYEAQVFAERSLSDVGILTTLDPVVAERLREMMTSYMAYFTNSKVYERELSHALDHAAIVIDRLLPVGQIESEKCFTIAEVEALQRTAEQGIKISRERWQVIVIRYHEFMFCLTERDLLE